MLSQQKMHYVSTICQSCPARREWGWHLMQARPKISVLYSSDPYYTRETRQACKAHRRMQANADEQGQLPLRVWEKASWATASSPVGMTPTAPVLVTMRNYPLLTQHLRTWSKCSSPCPNQRKRKSGKGTFQRETQAIV